jgi:hypothetical protein
LNKEKGLSAPAPSNQAGLNVWASSDSWSGSFASAFFDRAQPMFGFVSILRIQSQRFAPSVSQPFSLHGVQTSPQG